MNASIDLFNFYEPFTALILKIFKIFFIDQTAALLHFLAVFLILLSFRFYFFSTGLINKKYFFLISFIFIFNPLTLQLVTIQTRQFFFTSLISFPFNYLAALHISKNFNLKFFDGREKILRNRLIPFIFAFLAFLAHSSFPLIFLYFGILFFVFNILKFVLRRQNMLKILTSLKMKYVFYFCLITPITIGIFYLISDRLFYVVSAYSTINESISQRNPSMIFDTGSITLIFSAFINLSLFFYLGWKIPARFMLLKAFMFSGFIGLTFPFVMASIFPFLTRFLARGYMPIGLLSLPIALVVLTQYIKTRFVNFIIIIFTISAFSLQTQKYLNYNSKNTYFSLGNESIYSCSLVPFRD